MSYKLEPDSGRVGALANLESRNLISRAVENAEGLPFGAPVVRGTLDEQCRLPKEGDTEFLGVAITHDSVMGLSYPQFTSARIATQGVVWVKVSEAVKAGDKAAVTLATAEFAKTVADGVTVLMANAVYDSSAAAGGIAKLRIK